MPMISAGFIAEFEYTTMLKESVSDQDIHLSRLSGLAPGDIDTLCDFTRNEGLLLIIRCPKRPARYFHGKYDPKPSSVKSKSNPETGLVTLPNGKIYVSDYDLMCVYRFYGVDGYHKIHFSGSKANPGILPPEATALLNKVKEYYKLKSDFQHGAQDDYESASHPNVTMKTDRESGKYLDRFIAFNLGNPQVLANPTLLKAYYEKYGLDWPYDNEGRHRSYSE